MKCGTIFPENNYYLGLTEIFIQLKDPVMELKMELTRINLAHFRVEFDNKSQLVVRSNAQDVQQCFALSEIPLFLSIQKVNDSIFLVVSEGIIQGEIFKRIFRSKGAEPAFKVFNLSGIGIADERNILRIVHEYDLSQTPIALILEDQYLEAVCSGNPAAGNLSWYTRQEQGQSNLSQAPL